jgi:hypothetical protein
MSEILGVIRGAQPTYTFVTLYECLYGPNFRRHPSWVYSHKSCGSAVAAWPAPTVAEPCPVSEWSDWSMCDSNCGPGTRTRVRLTLPPGREKTVAACANVPLLESTVCSAAVDCDAGCTFTDWTAWGTCSSSCGGGTVIRIRTRLSGPVATCGPLLESKLCNMQRCASATL